MDIFFEDGPFDGRVLRDSAHAGKFFLHSQGDVNLYYKSRVVTGMIGGSPTPVGYVYRYVKEGKNDESRTPRNPQEVRQAD